VKHPNFNLIHNISFFSRFVFDEFIAKGAEYVHKVDRTLVNWVVERRNMINVDIRGELALRWLGGVCFFGFAAFHATCGFCSFSFF
jgi:hypothetical protein